MSIAKQLYQLQEIDLEIESKEQALRQMGSQLGESQAVVEARSKLTSEEQNLEELRHQQHSLEWEIEDIGTKLAAAEETLYGGRIKNPKELTGLQHEVETMKARRVQLEDKALEIMELVETRANSIAALSNELKGLEADWNTQQQRLSGEIEQHKTVLTDLKHKRQGLADSVDPAMVELYQALRKHKGTAVVKIEQGRCQGCRISLPITDLQQARSGKLVQCSNCGRILFAA